MDPLNETFLDQFVVIHFKWQINSPSLFLYVVYIFWHQYLVLWPHPAILVLPEEVVCYMLPSVCFLYIFLKKFTTGYVLPAYAVKSIINTVVSTPLQSSTALLNHLAYHHGSLWKILFFYFLFFLWGTCYHEHLQLHMLIVFIYPKKGQI